MSFFLGLLFSTLLILLGLYRWFKKRPPSQQYLDDKIHLARKALSDGHPKLVLDELSSLLIEQSPPEAVYELYALALLRLQQGERALAVLEDGFSVHPNSQALTKVYASTLIRVDRAEEALQALNGCEADSIDENTRIDLATALLRTHQAEQAWETLADHVLESSSGRLLALAGDCHFALKNYPLAVSFYQQAQHYGWVNQRTTSRTGLSLHREGQYREAERYFRKILECDSGDTEATLGLGTCYEQQGMFQRALIVYQCGDAWDRADPRILRQAGICAAHTKQFAYAEVYLKEAAAKGLSCPRVLAYLAFAQEEQRKWSEAEASYLRLIESFPEHSAGYRGLAWMYGAGLSSRLTEWEGLSLAQRSLQLHADASAWELLSACEARAGNFGRAHEIQEKLSVNTQDADTLRRRRLAMRALRKRMPLDENLIGRNTVA